VCRCHWQLRLKPFGDELDEDDLVTLDATAAPKEVLARVHDEVPEFTVHVTADSMQAFLGMQPGGVNPFTPKVLRPRVPALQHRQRRVACT
jgi:hypothetical protein